jgi:RNA polymerase primary sigma factor
VEALAAHEEDPTSLQARVRVTDTELGDSLAAPEQDYAGDVDSGMRRAAVRDLLTVLEPRELAILSRRFGLDSAEPKTLQQLGSELGISRERVRQIEVGALERMRASAIRRGLHPGE